MHAENIIDTVKKSPLVKKYINGELTKKVYFINADGGYGKTTALKSLYYYLVNTVACTSYIVPIFIDVKLLTDFGNESKDTGLGNMPRPLEKYIVKKYCGYDNDPDESLLEKVINIFSNNSPKFNNKYTYYIFVDGTNEVDDNTKSTIFTEIKEMLECGRVKFFISSRIDEKELPDETVKYKLMPLAEENIRKYLDNKFGNKYGEKVDISKINDSLVEILRVPMYLSVFRKTYDKKSPYPDIYEQNTVRKADLLDSYVQKILNDNKEKKRKEYNLLIEFVIKYFLPAMAFKAYKDHSSMQISDKEFRDLRKDTNYFDSLLVPDELIKCFNSNSTAIKGICLNSGLVRFTNGYYTFTHQNWRDLFAAKHIINCMNAEKLDELEETVYPNIRQFVGELIREYDNKFKYSKKYDDENDNRKCECDFEKKDNLKTWNESPIEHYMQHSNLGDSPIVTKNLIEIMKNSRNGNVTSSYDGLDLKYVSFYKCNLKGSTFNNTKVYSYNFILPSHKSVVNSVAFSPDGTKIVSGSYDETIRIWNVETGLQIGKPLTGHTDWVNSVAFSPDSTKIVSGSNDNTIRIWNVETGLQIGKPLMGHTDEVYSVSFSPDGTKIVSGSKDKSIRIWDVKTGLQIGKPLTGHTEMVNSVAFSPDGTKIVSGSTDDTIRIWDAETGLQIGKPLTGHTFWVNSVVFSPDGTKIVSGSEDETIRIWDVKTGKQIGEPLTGHTSWVNSVAFSPDGTKIVSGSTDETIRIWDTETGNQIGKPLIGHTVGVNSIAISQDGTKIVSGSWDRTIRIWNVKTGLQIGLIGHVSRVGSVSFSPDSTKIVSEIGDETIRIWDVENGLQTGEPLTGHADWVNSVVFSPDGTKIVSGSNDNTVRIWDIETGKQIEEPLIGHTDIVNSVVFSPDGTKIVSGSEDETIRIWDVETGLQIGEPITGHTGWENSVSFSPDGTKIVSGSDTIRIWDVKTGKQIGKALVGHHVHFVDSVSFSADGTKMVSGNVDTTVRIWDIKTGSQIGRPFLGHISRVTSVAFSPDSTKIVSGSNDNTVRVWDIKTGKQSGEPLTGHTDGVTSVAFSPNSTKIVSGSWDGTIRIWDLISHMCRIIEPIFSYISNCDFRDITYSGNDKEEFYRILYSNGGLVNDEFKPKPVPFEYNEEN